jgi:DNA-binding HxlR family transcriptional regulator
VYPGEERFLQGWYATRVLLSAEWTPSILVALLGGPLHYKDLLSAVRSLRAAERWSDRHQVLHESILSRSLRALTADGLIVRVQDPGVFPPSVQYRLMPAAREIVQILVPAAEWSKRHPEIVERAQQRRVGGGSQARSGRLRV